MDQLSRSSTAVLAHAFDLGVPDGVAVLADHGERGRIWRLTTDRGTWALKQSPIAPDDQAVRTELAFQAAAAASGIPFPRPQRTRDGGVLLDGATLPDAGLGGSVRAFEWVELDPETEASPAEVGRLTAALHRLDLPVAADDEPWWGPGVDPAEWPGLVEEGRRAGEVWADQVEAALPDIRAMAALATPDDPAALRLCHRDLSVLNVRRTRAGGLVVLDWESCGAADPVRELAVLVTVYLLERSREGALALYRAYVAAGGPARVRALADFSPVARGMQTLIRLYARQSLDPALPAETRAFARERLGWVLGGPMLPIVTDLLARLDDVAAG